MSTWEERTLVEDLLARGVDDWVCAAEVIDVASRSGASDPFALRALSVGLIAEVLVSGLMVAGDTDGSGFSRWGCSAAEAINKVSNAWFGREQPVVMPGDVVWLDTTEQGRDAGCPRPATRAGLSLTDPVFRLFEELERVPRPLTAPFATDSIRATRACGDRCG